MSNVTREQALGALDFLLEDPDFNINAAGIIRAFIEAAPEKGGEAVAWRVRDRHGEFLYVDSEKVADFYAGFGAKTPLYAHPAAAKEPGVTEAMVYAFHNALSDGPLGQQDFDDIKTALTAALAQQQGKGEKGECLHEWATKFGPHFEATGITCVKCGKGLGG